MTRRREGWGPARLRAGGVRAGPTPSGGGDDGGGKNGKGGGTREVVPPTDPLMVEDPDSRIRTPPPGLKATAEKVPVGSVVVARRAVTKGSKRYYEVRDLLLAAEPVHDDDNEVDILIIEEEGDAAKKATVGRAWAGLVR